MANLQKLERPNGAGVVAYGSIKRMKKGAEIQGTYLETRERINPREPGKTSLTHYFMATKPGSFENAEGDQISYSPGDKIGVNGTTLLNEYVKLLKPGAEVIIRKTGVEKTKNNNPMQLVDVYIVASSSLDEESLD